MAVRYCSQRRSDPRKASTTPHGDPGRARPMNPHDIPPSHVRTLARVLVVALVIGLLSLVSVTAAEASGDPCGPSGNTITCENSKPGSPASEWDVDGSGSDTIQGFPHRHLGERRLDRAVQDRHRRLGVLRDDLPHRLLRRHGRPQDRHRHPLGVAAAAAAAVRQRHHHPARRLRQLGGLGVVGRALERCLRRLHRPAEATDTGAPATSPSSCATTAATPTWSSRPPTRPGRPTTPTAARTSTAADPTAGPTS